MRQNEYLWSSYKRLIALTKQYVAPYQVMRFNPLTDEKILDWSKLKQIAVEI